jgi:hypothetical protein
MTKYFFKRGIRQKLTWFRDSLKHGEPGYCCSLCGRFIRLNEEPWLIGDVDQEARLHFRCFWMAIEIRKDGEHASDEKNLRTRDDSSDPGSVPDVAAALADPGLDGWTAARVGLP